MSATTSLDDNPLLSRSGLPQFDRIRPEHVIPAVRQMLAEVTQQLESIETAIMPTWDAIMTRMQEIDVRFEQTWGPVSHLFGVCNSPELREAYEEVLNEVVEFGLRVRQSRPIHDALRQLRSGSDWNHLNGARRRIVERYLQDAELAGIGLPPEQRERFNQIEQELSRLSTDFSNHVLDATKAFSLTLTDAADADGLPSSLRQLAAQSWNSQRDEQQPEATAENGPWRITLEIPLFSPFLEHCRRRDLRETLYRQYITRASTGEFDNTDIILDLLRLRKEKARMLGFRTFAELSLARKMAPNVDAVNQMFDALRTASWDASQTEMHELQQIAAANGQTEPMMHWDVAYWAERLRESRFDFTDEQLRPYFPFERVLDGVFALVQRLFDITVENAEGTAPVWHDDVRFFNIRNNNGEHIASFYLDPFSRPENKRGGAWMNDCLCRRRMGDRLQLPVAHLVCNGTPPIGGKPSLMTFREVETLFHEFGHGLQHMLTTVDDADAAGINGVEWDAVELPSQFMENWCYHRPTLLSMTAHFETGQTLPEELFEKIVAARTFRAGSQMLRQLQFGMTDIELHSTFDPEGDETILDVQQRVGEQTAALPVLPENRFLCSFQHIFSGGYAAGYYSYKWAEVLSADAFGAFEEAGLDDDRAIRTTGHRFRDTVLALGGSQHPMEIFTAFRGREPDPQALLTQYGLGAQTAHGRE